MYCPNCRTVLPEDASFCTSCGKDIVFAESIRKENFGDKAKLPAKDALINAKFKWTMKEAFMSGYTITKSMLTVLIIFSSAFLQACSSSVYEMEDQEKDNIISRTYGQGYDAVYSGCLEVIEGAGFIVNTTDSKVGKITTEYKLNDNILTQSMMGQYRSKLSATVKKIDADKTKITFVVSEEREKAPNSWEPQKITKYRYENLTKDLWAKLDKLYPSLTPLAETGNKLSDNSSTSSGNELPFEFESLFWNFSGSIEDVHLSSSMNIMKRKYNSYKETEIGKEYQDILGTQIDDTHRYFAIMKFNYSANLAGYLIRTPGQFESSEISLFVYDKTARAFIAKESLADSHGDDNYSVVKDTWFKELNDDGLMEIITLKLDDKKGRKAARELTAKQWKPNKFVSLKLTKNTIKKFKLNDLRLDRN